MSRLENQERLNRQLKEETIKVPGPGLDGGGKTDLQSTPLCKVKGHLFF